MTYNFVDLLEKQINVVQKYIILWKPNSVSIQRTLVKRKYRIGMEKMNESLKKKCVCVCVCVWLL